MTCIPAVLSGYRKGVVEKKISKSEVYMNIHDEIAKVAYNLWEKSGRIPGREVENWVEAERIVMERYGEKGKGKEKPKRATTHEKMPVELKKTLLEKIKKEAPEKKAVAKKTVIKTESKKEARKTK